MAEDTYIIYNKGLVPNIYMKLLWIYKKISNQLEKNVKNTEQTFHRRVDINSSLSAVIRKMKMNIKFQHTHNTLANVRRARPSAGKNV